MNFGRLYFFLRRKAWWVFSELLSGLSLLRGRLRRRKSFLRDRFEGDDSLEDAASIAIFMHWDSQGLVHPYVREYLESLRQAGFTILLVTNSPKLPEASLTLLKPLCARILWRWNVGYDFGAYKEAVLHIRELLPKLQRLVIANDSVYGPFHPLAESLDRADPALADVWGMTDSWERRYHLQSYFLLFHPQALRSPAFIGFWDGIPFVNNKHCVISRFEIGFSRAMLKAGLRLSAVYSYDEVARDFLLLWRRLGSDEDFGKELPKRARQFLTRMVDSLIAGEPVNPTHYFWDFLIARWRFPFIKRELLTRNPGNVSWLSRWKEIVGEVSDYDTRMIEDHLKANARRRR